MAWKKQARRHYPLSLLFKGGGRAGSSGGLQLAGDAEPRSLSAYLLQASARNRSWRRSRRRHEQLLEVQVRWRPVPRQRGCERLLEREQQVSQVIMAAQSRHAARRAVANNSPRRDPSTAARRRSSRRRHHRPAVRRLCYFRRRHSQTKARGRVATPRSLPCARWTRGAPTAASHGYARSVTAGIS